MSATADQARVRAALNRWARARRASAGPGDPELLAARVGLAHLLEDAGWCPPAAVRAGLAADERRLHSDEPRLDSDEPLHSDESRPDERRSA